MTIKTTFWRVKQNKFGGKKTRGRTSKKHIKEETKGGIIFENEKVK